MKFRQRVQSKRYKHNKGESKEDSKKSSHWSN